MYYWALLILAMDRLSKRLLIANVDPGESRPVVNGVVHFTYVKNTGAAFAIFTGGGTWLILLTAVFVVGIVFWYRSLDVRSHKQLWNLSVGMILGGAVGNLVDRVTRGFVIDFIDVRIWPVFNVADIALTIGCLLLVYLLLQEESLRKGREGM